MSLSGEPELRSQTRLESGADSPGIQILELKKELATMRSELAGMRGDDGEKAQLAKDAKRYGKEAKAELEE